MADPARYRYMETAGSGRRSPPLYNPARSSMPISLYDEPAVYMPGNLHRSTEDYRTVAGPVAANTYAVRKDPLSRSTSVTDGTRAHRITDQNIKRPVIVTAKHHPPGPRSGSPSRDPYRSSDEGQYYAEPASSIPRSRAAHAPSSAAMDDEEYRRLRDRTHQDRLGNRGADPYRQARPGPLYAGPNHRANTFDFDDEGYEYTKPSDLARYDLDHDQRQRTRRESLDRYYRPTVSITTDMSRPFDPADRRARGPPPTTRGLDRLGWPAAAGGIYDGAGSRMPLPPAGHVPDLRRPGHSEPPGSPREEHRGGFRPLSMIQDDPGRSSHHPDYYFEDALPQRDARDRDRDFFQDDRVNARGFGLLIDPNDLEEHRRVPGKVYREDERRERREPQKRYEVREPRRRQDDDDLEIVRHEYDDREHRRHRDHEYVLEDEARRDRNDRRSDDDEPDARKDKTRGKVAAGLGLAAASVGLAAAGRAKDDRDHEDRSSPRRRANEDDHRKPEEADSRANQTGRKEPLLGDEEFELVEHPSREKPRNGTAPAEAREPKSNGDAAPPRDHSPRDPSPRDPSTSGDEEKPKARRRLRASGFNPNDTAALADMKARLAEMKSKDAPPARTDDRLKPALKNPSPTEDRSPERKPAPTIIETPPSDVDASAIVPKDTTSDPTKNRDLAPRSSPDDKQVRLVSPPKESLPVEKKPIKGILKQPRAQFPEENNPVREGVAPHKDDKTKPDVPQGARWTKISRKMVNPEALKIGKERFEVRDEFVIVLRVLSKEEIQAYAGATATLRGTFFFRSCCCCCPLLPNPPKPPFLLNPPQKMLTWNVTRTPQKGTRTQRRRRAD